jgi:acetyl esterase
MNELARRSGMQDTDAKQQNLAAVRAELVRMARLFSPVALDVHVVDRHIPGPAGPIPVRVYRPYGVDSPAPGVVYAHGGGFMVGNLDSHDPTCRILAVVSGCVVVAVDYRLAPEHLFPAAVDDMMAAYRWVLAHGGELGIDPTRLAVMGDSAGGNLAAVMAIEARDAGDVAPKLQCLVYPLTDSTLAAPSYQTFAEGFGLTLAAIIDLRDAYLGEQGDREDPRASPLLAADHTGLPPALVVTGGFDPLRDDGLAYADTLRSAGVEVDSWCFDDFTHAFFSYLVVPDARAATEQIARRVGDTLRA